MFRKLPSFSIRIDALGDENASHLGNAPANLEQPALIEEAEIGVLGKTAYCRGWVCATSYGVGDAVPCCHE